MRQETDRGEEKMSRIKTVLAAVVLAVLPVFASAQCNVNGSGEVNVLSNFFDALEVLADAMEECERDDLKIDAKLTTSHQEEREVAFAASTSPYDASAVANFSITSHQANGELLPLNALVDKYREQGQLEDQMLIRFGDDIMAIAFMANAQVLFYRKDILAKHGLDVPTTWDELFAAAEILTGDDEIAYPYGAAFGGPGNWERGNEFVNILFANGGQLFDPVTSEAAFNSPEGIQALEIMGRLTQYMSPNALSHDFGNVNQLLSQGEIAMAIQWQNEALGVDDPNESIVSGKIGLAPAPAIDNGSPPSSLFWWDGFVIPKNLDGDPDVTFQVLLHALRPEVVEQNNDVALWLRSNYESNIYTQSVNDTIMLGAPPFPMNPQSGLAHSAIGNNIGDYLAGKESAARSLADAEAEYTKAARAQGYIN